MGSFTTMLLAAAKNPAMLLYLNLAQSTKAAVNENYGRELLEVHTVGRVYSENDVENAAKLLTGRTVDDYGHYMYDEYIHGTGAVSVLGFRSANTSATGGEKAGDDLLRYLAGHTATATNLARKLCIRLVSDTPSSDLVNAVAKAYLTSGTQILPMVSTILRSTEFWQSRGLKVRRPAENLIATIRVLDLTPTDLSKALPTLHWQSGGDGALPARMERPEQLPRRRDVALLILDIGLPDADGRDVAMALRARGIGVPILMLTARGNLVDRLGGFHAGADDYLVKPFRLRRAHRPARSSRTADRRRRNPRRRAPSGSGHALGLSDSGLGSVDRRCADADRVSPARTSDRPPRSGGPTGERSCPRAGRRAPWSRRTRSTRTSHGSGGRSLQVDPIASVSTVRGVGYRFD